MAAMPLITIITHSSMAASDWNRRSEKMTHIMMPAISVSAVKLIAMPGLMWVLCNAMDLPLLITQVMVISAALPASPSSYVLASQMGGDAKTVASAITLQHVLGMGTVALVAGWMLSA